MNVIKLIFHDYPSFSLIFASFLFPFLNEEISRIGARSRGGLNNFIPSRKWWKQLSDILLSNRLTMHKLSSPLCPDPKFPRTLSMREKLLQITDVISAPNRLAASKKHCLPTSRFQLLKISLSIGICQGRSQGGRGKPPPPPETEKNVVEKWCISEGSIFSNKYSKIK